jgi:hypothetical protein
MPLGVFGKYGKILYKFGFGYLLKKLAGEYAKQGRKYYN